MEIREGSLQFAFGATHSVPLMRRTIQGDHSSRRSTWVCWVPFLPLAVRIVGLADSSRSGDTPQ